MINRVVILMWEVVMIAGLLLTAGCSHYAVLSGRLDIGMGLNIEPCGVKVTDYPVDIPVQVQNYSNVEIPLLVSVRRPDFVIESCQALSPVYDPDYQLSCSIAEATIQPGDKLSFVVHAERLKADLDKEAWISVRDMRLLGVKQELILRVVLLR